MIAADTLGEACLTGLIHVHQSSIMSLCCETHFALHAELNLALHAGSYGSTKRYKSFQRLRKVNDRTVIGAGGELSDFQYLLTLLDELTTEDFVEDDGASLSPQELFAYISRVLYNRRSK